MRSSMAKSTVEAMGSICQAAVDGVSNCNGTEVFISGPPIRPSAAPCVRAPTLPIRPEPDGCHSVRTSLGHGSIMCQVDRWRFDTVTDLHGESGIGEVADADT
jgi:hypothetical protein